MSDKDKKDMIPHTLQDQAWKRATDGSKPKAGTPYDWEDYERSEKEKQKDS